MNLEECQGPDELAQAAHRWVEAKRVACQARSIFLPAGRTPEGLYSLWRGSRPEWLRSLTLCQLDEVVTGPRAGMFREAFLEWLPECRSQFRWADDEPGGPADLAVLGLGGNGHVAFHEPGLPASLARACVRLEPETLASLGLKEPTWGSTYGAATFIQARAILIVAQGRGKKDAVRRLVQTPPEDGLRFPAAFLSKHPDLTVIVDREAAGSL